MKTQKSYYAKVKKLISVLLMVNIILLSNSFFAFATNYDEGYEPLIHDEDSIYESTYLASNSNIASSSNVDEYVRTVMNSIPESVQIDDVYTLDEAFEYFTSFFSEQKIKEYNLQFAVRFFRAPSVGKTCKDGSFRVRVYDDEGIIANSYSIKILTEKYKDFPQSLLCDDYAEKYQEAITNLWKTGVSMSEVSTPDEAKTLVESIAPDGKPDNVQYEVEIGQIPINGNSTVASFITPQAGTINRKNGKPGFFTVYITFTNDLCRYNVSEAREHMIKIKPIPYRLSSSGSSGGGSSSGSSYTPSSNPVISVAKKSVTEGSWYKDGNYWRLKLPNNSYASSQWAFINGKWYIFDNAGYMLTGWKFVNNKWYYMDQSGAMAANTVTPDGYKVNENGEWIQ